MIRRHCGSPPAIGHLFLALVLGIVATGCGSEPPPAPTALRVLMTDDWATPPFLSAVREFEGSHPGVRIEIEKLPIRHMGETVRAQVAEGNPPDVVQWHAFAAGAQGLAEPLDDLWQSYDIQASEYFPGAVEDVTWGSHLYGVPLDTNALTLFYRVDSLRSANLPIPPQIHSFDDLERYAKALSKTDGTQKAMALPNSYWQAYGWIRANGGEVLEVADDGAPRFTFDSPPVVEAVAFLSSLVRNGYAFPPAGADSGNDALSLFRAGTAAMHTSGSWDLATLQKDPTGDNYRVTLMPNGVTGQTKGTAMGGSSLFVPKGAKHRVLAFEFMQLLTNDHYALRLAKEEGRLPVRTRVFSDPYFQDPGLQVFLEQLKTAHPLLVDAFPLAAKALDKALNEVLFRGADAATSLKEAQKVAESSLRSSPGT